MWLCKHCLIPAAPLTRGGGGVGPGGDRKKHKHVGTGTAEPRPLLLVNYQLRPQVGGGGQHPAAGCSRVEKPGRKALPAVGST